MTILSNFELYLKEWCTKNNKPLPNANKPNDIWKMAWDSYVKEKLVPNWEEHKQSYLNMELLTKKEQNKRKNVKVEEIEEVEEPTSQWDEVSRLLK